MADVTFQEDPGLSTPRPAVSQSGGSLLVQLMYKAGLAKTAQGAQYALLGVAVFCVIASIGSLFWGGIL
jgi:hypothetical protein